MSQELVQVEAQPLALRHELSVEEVVARIHKVHQAMEKAMVQDHHYGVIPGTKKPTLLKPGAELLNVMFRLDPQYATETLRDGDHLTVTSTCTLWHIPTGQRMGSGQGSCSTRESKYAWREQQRTCPECGKAAIIKGKAEYGGGWLCFKKREGCGAKFKDGDAAIEAQQTGRVPNPDLADAYNTVLKMANKRSLVAAVLNVTAASDIFTQDLEDLQEGTNGGQGGREPAQSLTAPPRQRESETEMASQHAGLEKERLPAETIEQHGDRLFDDDPAKAVTVADRATLLGQITACQDMLRAKGPDRKSQWARYVGDYTEQTAPIPKLQALLAELRSVLPEKKA